MPRNRRCRRIGFRPEITYFKPAGIGIRELEESTLTFEELEAVRLKDLKKLDQEEAAKKMEISQPTFHRLILEARKKIADAIVNGKSIKIEGGNYKMISPRRGKFEKGSRRGRMGGPLSAGPGGICKCPKCKYEEPQIRGNPCIEKKCPKCGAKMIRRQK